MQMLRILGQGAVKQGVAMLYQPFLLHKTRDTPSRVNREVPKSPSA